MNTSIVIILIKDASGYNTSNFSYIDPFVKVKITFKGKRVFKWKTSVKHRTLNPVYNESFSYEVTDDMRMTMDVEGVMISFGIVDHDFLMPNDKMGYINVGKHATTKLGRQQWDEVLKSPQHRISFWHPIQLANAAQKRQMRSRCTTPVPPEFH